MGFMANWGLIQSCLSLILGFSINVTDPTHSYCKEPFCFPSRKGNRYIFPAVWNVAAVKMTCDKETVPIYLTAWNADMAKNREHEMCFRVLALYQGPLFCGTLSTMFNLVLDQESKKYDSSQPGIKRCPLSAVLQHE